MRIVLRRTVIALYLIHSSKPSRFIQAYFIWTPTLHLHTSPETDYCLWIAWIFSESEQIFARSPFIRCLRRSAMFFVQAESWPHGYFICNWFRKISLLCKKSSRIPIPFQLYSNRTNYYTLILFFIILGNSNVEFQRVSWQFATSYLIGTWTHPSIVARPHNLSSERIPPYSLVWVQTGSM